MSLACPSCKEPIDSSGDIYTCPACRWKINKVHAHRPIGIEVLHQLETRGHTDVLDGFINKSGKPFQAALTINIRGVDFRFSDQVPQASVSVRVESYNSGTVNLSILGKQKFKSVINFGLCPAKECEALGTIVAARFLLHNGFNKKIIISANDKTFVEYVLWEKTPRGKEIQAVIESLRVVLKSFDSWGIKYERQKPVTLNGGQKQVSFPKGIFPDLITDIKAQDSVICVNLPGRVEVQAQFAACFPHAAFKDNIYTLPASSEPAVKAWIASVVG